MSKIEHILDLVKGKDGQIVTIIVRDEDNRLMMAKRRDNDRWTLPGGHMEEGEEPEEAAKRELYEEAGLKASKLKKLTTKTIKTFTGKKMTIHAFQFNGKNLKPTSKNDPDKEVAKWEFIDVTHGLPESIADNLHSPKNVALKKIGLQKSMLYVTDLIKGMNGHKYLRKYRRGDTWVYVYHEGQNHGRAIPEEAINHIRTAAEAGHGASRALLETLQEHNHEKLQLLRQAADAGHEPAHEHLKRLGINRKKEKLEEKVMPKAVIPAMDAATKTKVEDALNSAVGKAWERFRSHPNSVPEVRWRNANVTKESIMEGVATAPNLEAALKKIHENLKPAHTAHEGVTSAYDWASSAGGYSNAIYNQFLKDLESRGVVPEGYAEKNKRTDNNHQAMPIEGFEENRQRLVAERREREAREAAERAEADRIALGELQSSMAGHVSSLMATRQPVAKIRELDSTLREIFGRPMKKEDFPWDFSHKNLTTVVKAFSVSNGVVTLDMQVKDEQGNEMMSSWQRRISKRDGRPEIYNAYMAVKESARGSVQVGNLINEGQRKLMKSLPGGGVIRVTANIDVGGYNWANQGFSYSSTSDLNYDRVAFKDFLRGKGINLSDEDMSKFKEPVHFASFSDGKKHIMDTSRGAAIALSQHQIDTRSLTGVPGEHPLTDREIRDKKATRMAVSLGKMFMLGRSWSGTWDSAKETDASKFADRYYEMRDRAVDLLTPEYKGVLKATKAGQRTQAVPEPRSAPRPTATPTARPAATSSTPQVATATALVSNWMLPGRNGRRGRVRMTAQRIARVVRLTQENFDHFVRTANLTPVSRRALLRARSEANTVP